MIKGMRSLLTTALLILIVGCATPTEPEPDLILARNLAKMQTRPSNVDLAWRTPKERVAGVANANAFVARNDALLTASLKTALEYSLQHAGQGLMVWHDGNLIASQFAAGLTARSPFASYSMHKSVLALTLLAAIEDGYLTSLDDPVGRYLKVWRNDPRGDITLRQLLNHASGLTYYSYTAPEAAAINFSGRMREAAINTPLSSAPGTSFQYNNVNSLVLGLALEKALEKRGLRYAQYLSQRIWQPLGNGDAAVWLDHPGGVARYHSGLEAGLGSWLNIGVMLANGGRVGERQVLSTTSITALTEASSTNPAYGLHVWLGSAWQQSRSYGPGTPQRVLHSEPYLASDVWFFDGFGGQRVYVIPSARLVIARFGAVDMAYDDAYIVNTLLRGLGETTP
ncbi:MAG: serine hydrolase domain-containing protein [Gammaproteobacteria bacterium]